MSVILIAENISKQYRLGLVGTGTLAHDLNRFWHRIRGKEDPYLKVGALNVRNAKASSDYVWALQDINFEVQKGEVLGIIGRNGAGKSTLLKILSRVTSPTTGVIKTKGRIASLLEVGTGFHSELTGRENIYLNGAILGMTKSEISSKIDEIVAFSGCEMYIDTPVKRYSSGMTVRLAFAVAAHLEPDILIIDEVLAVGDVEFQKKAIGKVKEISKGEGRTVLFVSHDMNAISLLTDRVLVLKNGKVSFEGETDLAIKEYLKGESEEPNYHFDEQIDSPKIREIYIDTSLPNNIHEFGKKLKINFKVELPFGVDNLALSFQVIDEIQAPITHLWQIDSQFNVKREKGVYLFSCIVEKSRLYIGNYSLRVYLSDSKNKERFDFIDSACNFKIEMIKNKRDDYNWEPGSCKYIEDSKWVIEKI
ncbi:ABC transporter ATP-binding protein [Ulvibacter litoralis]|uniref:Lipopolysaccharide transport system ATP-binding protein n=1 Tax=Ulvibacter litoralis TaxID=227084 RepID=A0A1G7GUN7_9FLAO|nr:ABC transporter ATP-binding protein [Ulvibacter litoralis]GHC60028.1 ABC transporter ATP-binding protein [Ulvibacter litoralis]SDE91811.1 lipopolysaccharide transport system ATP-binding protein [Ulvibacter litoralis]